MPILASCLFLRAFHVWLRFHNGHVNVEHVVDGRLQLLCTPWSMVSIGGVEVANAKAKGSPSKAALRVHRPRAHLVEWRRKHATKAVQGATCGSWKQANPCANCGQAARSTSLGRASRGRVLQLRAKECGNQNRKRCHIIISSDACRVCRHKNKFGRLCALIQ